MEKPLLAAESEASVDLGLQMLKYQYYSLLVLLMVSSRELRAQAIIPSRMLLELLPRLGELLEAHKEPYGFVLWQCLRCPAFGALWGDIVVRFKGEPKAKRSEASLHVIEHLPVFFGKFKFRNPLAAKLESITARMVQYAGSLSHSEGKCHQPEKS